MSAPAGWTPGPWTASKTGKGSYGWVVQGPFSMQLRGSEAIADIPFAAAVPGNEAANARLIAAAPDLADALEGLVRLALGAMQDANRDGCEYQIDAELAAARAALALAKGERP